MRIYPVPFRRLDQAEQYRKYDWIECQLLRNRSDPRPETFRPLDEKELHPVGHLDTANAWQQRRQILLRTAQVYDRLDELISGAKANQLSLAIFKPTRVSGFFWESEDRQWSETKLKEMRQLTNQLDLFADNSWRETFQVIPKLPYSFSYRFEDAAGKHSELQVLDWEVGALYWKCLRSAKGDESAALAKVRQKYLGQFLKTDLHFYLGTTQQFHFVGANPWVIVGVLPIPHDPQIELL